MFSRFIGRRLQNGFAALCLLSLLLAALYALPVTISGDDDVIFIQGEAGAIDPVYPGLATFTSLYPGRDAQTYIPDEDAEQTSLSDLKEGNIDIVAAGRKLSSADDPSHVLRDLMIGRYGVVMIVSASSSLDSISQQQIKQIYEGTLTNWSQLGGQSLVPRAMDTTTGIYASFISSDLAPGIDPGMEESAVSDTGLERLITDADMAAEIAASDDQVGYVSFGYLLQMDNSVKYLSLVNGAKKTAPLLQNIYNQSYPSRELHLWYRKDNNKTALTDYLEFILSPAGQHELELAGAIRKHPAADLNVDGKIDLGDLQAAAARLGDNGDPGWIEADINFDGVINILDMVLIGTWWEYTYTSSG